jgi:hypothetical protein
MTGLALLCFLGHGEITSSPEFGATVQKAVDHIIAFGRKVRESSAPGIRSVADAVYDHAITGSLVASVVDAARMLR